MVDPDSQSLGLRERKKRETRNQLRKAAISLVLERGLDRVTVEEISERAGYAPRTFFNYFRAKEEALIIEPGEEAGRLLDYLPSELEVPTLVDELFAAMLRHVQDVSIRVADVTAHHQLLERHPELVPQQMKVFEAEERRLAEELRLRCGVESAWPHVNVAAAVTMSAMRSAFGQWIKDDGTRPLEHYVRTAIDTVRDLVPTSNTGERTRVH